MSQALKKNGKFILVEDPIFTEKVKHAEDQNRLRKLTAGEDLKEMLALILERLEKLESKQGA
jgi:hypothetical protein